MDWYRIRHTIGMHLCSTAIKRAAYLKKHDILYHIGDNCMTMFRKIPLYPKLISMGNNVWIASDVLFVPHDVIHRMLNNKLGTDEFQENIGCIEIKDDVFVGSAGHHYCRRIADKQKHPWKWRIWGGYLPSIYAPLMSL